MKNIYCQNFLIEILLGIGILFSSCSDFLKEESYSFSTTKNLYATDKGAEMALTGVYDILNAGSIQGQGNHNMWGRGMHYMLMLGDDMVPNLVGMNDPEHAVIASCAYNSESEFVKMAWFGLYVGIDRANNIIQKVPDIDMDHARKNEIVAEASFFRAYYYLYLTWLFGEVPLHTVPGSDQMAPRESLDKVYAQIEKDLTLAYDSLPDRNKMPGRVNKWTAAGYLVKMYTYLAACKENNVGKELGSDINSFDWVNSADCYVNAETIAEDIYTNSSYKMITPFNHSFLADTKDNQKKECLMLAQTGIGGASEYFLFTFWAGPVGNVGVNGGGYGWIRPSGELCDKYNKLDPRFKWNIAASLTYDKDTLINNAKYFQPEKLNKGSNLCYGKFRQSDPQTRIKQGMPAWASNIDFPILRYADIVLLYAEAKYKNGDEPGARTLLAEVRKRACTNGVGDVNNAALDALNTTYYNADFMQELMDERLRELCAEGWRRIDLIRMGKMTSTIENMDSSWAVGDSPYYYYNPNLQSIKENYKPYKIWFPIPKREREVNANLKPNPGYVN